MKHLRIARRGKEIKIISQRYRGTDFNRGSIDFKSPTNGFSLISDSYPESYNYDPARPVLCVWGRSRDLDNRPISIRGDEWLEKLRVAVKEYNETFDN